MFQIGEFSKIGQVSARQLRRYAEMGLLEPIRVDPFTGYRYYSASQLPRLNKILALKEMGLTLAQIGEYLNENVSVEELRGMLALKRSQTEQNIQQETARLRIIESRIDQIDRDGALNPQEVVLKQVSSQNYLSTRQTFSSLVEGIMLMANMKNLLTQTIKPADMGYFTAIFHSDMFEDDALDVEVGLAVNSPLFAPIEFASGLNLTPSQLPQIETMLTTIRLGAPQTGHGSFASIGIWLEANNYKIAGPGREVFINFPPPHLAHQAVTEIQFPVMRLDKTIND